MAADSREGFPLTELASVALAGAIAVLVLIVPPTRTPYGRPTVSNMPLPELHDTSEPPQELSAQPSTQAIQEQRWPKPRFEEREGERDRMVREQISAPGRDIKDPRVLDAMRAVPRHLFVPSGYRGAAYADSPLPIGSGQTISQPYIVAFMTEALDVQPGERVLEIGTGSGYQAAVLGELTPHVFTIEIIKELAEQAAQRLQELGYSTIKVKAGDGYFGWREHAPFDAVIVTCAAGHVPAPLLDQLRPGGRLVIPVGGPYATQYLVLVTKDQKGELRSAQLQPVQFVPMTGRIQEDR
jgi:protein-L-isoaspartate(D-aspartate) O-methyltransferase